ncbi:intein C-terminal splicing domain protein [Leptospira kirschneri str. 200802841]|uniref:Intein C-terminal splicing domain protein n=2 Tax=Leptospira kirschneri TaxID=29507 RepID=A0A828XWP6_9LEPT|nr:intein C-terminal splicing domain protein [Leptospira kirschneri str. 200802841]
MVDKAGVFHLDTCFVGGTSVRTESGFKAIEDIQIGDVVRSWNEKSGKIESKRVTELFVHEVPQLFYLELDGEEVFQTTWNHPFRRRIKETTDLSSRKGVLLNVSLGGTEDKSFLKDAVVSNVEAAQGSEWVKVEDLKLRDQVLTSDGSWARVTGIFHYNVDPTKVYNFEVEDNHTYIVGENVSAIVHNYVNENKEVNAALVRTDRLRKLSGNDHEIASSLDDLKYLGKEFNKNAVEASKETNRLLFENFSAQQSLEIQGKKNLDFVNMVRSKDADNLPGIGKVRELLRGVTGEKGYTKSTLAAIDTWLKQDLSKNLPSGIASAKDMVGGYSSGAFNLGGFNKPGSGKTLAELGTHVGLWKLGRELGSVEGMAAGRQKIADTQSAISVHQNKMKERGVAEAKAIREIENRVETYVSKTYSNDPRFAEAIVSSRTIEKSSLSKNTGGVDFETKRKAFEFNLKPEQKAKIQEFDKQKTAILDTQERLEREDYAKHQKNHPGETYVRSPELTQRREKTLATIEHLEKQKSTFLNETLTHFPKEDRRIELEKIALNGKLTDKERNELNTIDKAKKAHENEVAALFDQNEKTMHDSVERNFGGERGVVVKNRFEQMDKLQSLETKLAGLDPKDPKTAQERTELRKQINKAEERVAQIDRNFLEYEPKRKVINGKEEPLGDYVLRKQQSYEQEGPAINEIVKQQEARRDLYERLGNKEKVKEIKDAIKKYTLRNEKSMVLAEDTAYTVAAKEDAKARTEGKPATAVAALERYMTHENEKGNITRTLPIDPKHPDFVHPIGNNPFNNQVTYTSHYGEAGYHYDKIADSALSSVDHIGNDFAAEYGDRVNTMLDGKVIGISKGLEIKVPSSALEAAGVIYLPEGLHEDGSPRKEGLYRKDEKTPLSREALSSIDPKFGKDPNYDGIRMKGVIYHEGGKKGFPEAGFYTMAAADKGKLLSTKQVENQIPREAIESVNDPKKLSRIVNSGGNSVTVESTFHGELSGTFQIEYKHFQEDPSKWVEVGKSIQAGKQIGNVGSTGRSTGPHMHTTVKYYLTTSNPPLDPSILPKGMYVEKTDWKGKYYEINGDFFLNEMLPKRLNKRK